MTAVTTSAQAADTDRETTGIECEGCGAVKYVGDENWENLEDIDWCPTCWVDYAPADEEILVPMTRLQAKAAKLCIDTVVEYDTGLTPRSMPEAAEAISRALAHRPSPK